MVEFVQEIQGCETHPLTAPAPLDNAFEVVTVYEGSIAHAAGITAGMLYIGTEEDREVADFMTLAAYSSRGVVHSRFIDSANRTEMRLTTAHFPFGVELLATTERMCRMIAFGEQVMTDAAQRVHRGDRRDFGMIADTFAARETGQSFDRSLWSIFRSADQRDAESTDLKSARIFVAAWAAENGDLERAAALLPDIDDDCVTCHGGGLTALYLYAYALCMEQSNAPIMDVIDVLEQAQEHYGDSVLVARKLRALSGHATNAAPIHQPEPFPGIYALPAHDPLAGPTPRDARLVSLQATLDTMREDQFALIVLLGSYRCNGYYSFEMETLAALWPVIGNRFPHVHIITSAPHNVRFPDWWMDGEAQARRAGVPVTVLTDAHDAVAEAVDLRSSPTIAVLDRTGRSLSLQAYGVEQAMWAAIRQGAPHPLASPSDFAET